MTYLVRVGTALNTWNVEMEAESEWQAAAGALAHLDQEYPHLVKVVESISEWVES